LYLATKNKHYAEVARDIITYVSRDLLDRSGGFYSAEDADSYPYFGAAEAKEGAFAVWEADEIRNILGKEEAEVFGYHFGVNEGGNVDGSYDPHGELVDKSVLIERHTFAETSARFKKSLPETSALLKSCLQKLWDARQSRPKPHRDDKIITSWNGLMISGLSKASRALSDPTILQLAKNAAQFIKQKLYNPSKGVLLRSCRENQVSDIEGFADDYAFLIQGLLDLYEASIEVEYLEWATKLQAKMDEIFWDEEGGGYFTGSASDTRVLLRMKEDHDGAEPTPSSVALSNILRLDAMVPGAAGEDGGYKKKAEKIMVANKLILEKVPRSVPYMVAGCAVYLKGFKEIIVHGNASNASTLSLLSVLNSEFLPTSPLIHVPESSETNLWLAAKNPVVDSIYSKGLDEAGGAEVFVCEAGSCQMPVDSVASLKEVLEVE
ncbi:spermatogenesis-associated protein 20, partial [Chytridiales sp. JEL 0842]